MLHCTQYYKGGGPLGFSRELLKGCIEPLILAVLHEGDSYGYLLARKIGERSSDSFALKDGTLYTALKRLEQDGLVVSYWGEHDEGGRRRYYQLTEAGREAHRAWLSDWAAFVHSMNAVLRVNS